jgi:nucleotide-binding universal stress UspA family protein
MAERLPQRTVPPVYVVGYDATRQAREALEFAAMLARATGAELLLAHVLVARRAGGMPAHAEDDAQAQAGLELARRELANVVSRATVVRETTPARGLQRLASSERAELIVVAASRRQDGEVGREGVGERLLHGSPCAVAVTPTEPTDRADRLGPVGCAFDGRPEARAALATAQALARALGSPLRLTGVADPFASGHVRPGETASRARLARLLELTAARCAVEVHTDIAVLDGRPPTRLAEISGELRLLVTGSRGYGAVGALLAESVSHHLIRRSACPVIAVPRGARAPRSAGGAPRTAAASRGTDGAAAP